MKITTIVKRDDKVEDFDKGKIHVAIVKAVEDVGGGDVRRAAELTDMVVARLESFAAGLSITVEETQLAILHVLHHEDHFKVEDAYRKWMVAHSIMRLIKAEFYIDDGGTDEIIGRIQEVLADGTL